MTTSERSFDCDNSLQLEPVQTRDSSGAPVWRQGDLGRLRRLLVLGCETGCLNIERGNVVMSQSNTPVLQQLLEDGHGLKVVEEIKAFSVEGRTADQNSILFALAYCCRMGDNTVREAAYACLRDVCRIPTHLFMFIEYCENLSQGTGWGRAHRRAVSDWYSQFESNPAKLAMLVTKYRNRESWTHRDVLRLCHLKPGSDTVALVTKYVVKGIKAAKEYYGESTEEKLRETLDYLCAVETVMKSSSVNEVVELISRHNLVREHMPTTMLNQSLVWKTLLLEMPMMAMVRNLGKMSCLKVLEEGTDELELVIMKLKDKSLIEKSRLHPLNILSALNVYKKGSGEKGRLSWTPTPRLTAALEEAVYLALGCVEPTGKRYCLAVDVSDAMDNPVSGLTGVSCRDASSVMLLSLVRAESNVDVQAFSSRLMEQVVANDARLDDLSRQLARVPHGNVDVTLPISTAQRRCRDYDVFIVFTDTKTYAASTHLHNTLKRYRHVRKIKEARFVLVGLSSSSFCVANADDPGMLDIAGFDASTPDVIRRFVLGQF